MNLERRSDEQPNPKNFFFVMCRDDSEYFVALVKWEWKGPKLLIRGEECSEREQAFIAFRETADSLIWKLVGKRSDQSLS